MSVAWDVREAQYQEELERLRPINEARAKDGLPPLAPGVQVDDYVERMFYAGPAPWNVNLGEAGTHVGVEEPQVAEQAIRLSGLDWRVELGDVWAGPNQAPLEGYRSIYRVTDGKVFGISAGRYTPIQNIEMFDFLDGLVEDRVMRYVTAGSIYGGKVVWILAKLDEDLRIAGDLYENYLLCTSGHDLKHSLKIIPTSMRVVCRNTLKMATTTDGFVLRIPHMGNVSNKFAAAKQTLAITTEQQRRYAAWLEQLAETPVSEEQVDEVRDGLFGTLDDDTPTRRKNAINAWLDILHAEEEREGENAYAVLQSITGYGDHGLAPRERQEQPGTARMVSFVDGMGAHFKQQGLAVLSTVTGIAVPA